jgi:hypothetical protein
MASGFLRTSTIAMMSENSMLRGKPGLSSLDSLMAFVESVLLESVWGGDEEGGRDASWVAPRTFWNLERNLDMVEEGG